MNRNFWITALITLINSLTFTIQLPIIYLYGKEFGLNNFQTSLLFSVYSISQFFATPVIGKLSDRFGRKPLLIISLAGTVMGNSIAGTATSAILLFFGRFLDGITGGNLSVAQAIISDITSPKDRAQAFGIYGAAIGLGFVLGPIISLLAQQISLGTAFLVSGAIAAIALLLTTFFLQETLPNSRKNSGNPFDLKSLGLGNLIKGLAMPRVGILLSINFLTGTTFTLFNYAFQLYFIHVLAQNSQSLTLLFLTFGAVGISMQTWGISLMRKKFQVSLILFLGLFLRGILFILMPIYPHIIYFVIITILFSLFNSLVQPMINTLTSLNAQPQELGMVMGLNASYSSIANAIGPVITGIIVQQSHPITYSYPFYLAGFLTFLVLLLAISTRKRYETAS